MDGFGQPPVQDTAENSLEGSSTVVVPNEPNDTTLTIGAQPTSSPTPLVTPAPAAPVPPQPISQPVTAPLPSPTTTPQPIQPIPTTASTPPSRPPLHKWRKRFQSFNIYLLAFVLLIIVAVAIVVIAFVKDHKAATPTISTQNLSQSQLEQLATTNVSVGNSSQVLTVGSNAIFSQQVLVQKDLDVAGNFKLGGLLSVPSLNVSGASILGQTQLAKLTVSGDTALQGSLSVGQDLSVTGNATFSGAVAVNSLTVQTLQLGGDVAFTHHLTAGGTTPSRTSGTALGSGGTTSIGGSDTAGSIAINTGTSPSAGCFITITFSQKFDAAPHMVVTPIGAAAAGLAYYVNRSTTSFSICTTSAAPAGQSFGFDYIVFD